MIAQTTKIMPDCVREQQRAVSAIRTLWNKVAQVDRPDWSPEVVDVRATSVDRVARYALDVDEVLCSFERAYNGPHQIGSPSMTEVARLVSLLRKTYYSKDSK